MSKNNKLISEVLEHLREVRVKVQGDVENSVIQQLDEAISKLEEACRDERQDRISSQEILKLLGKVLERLPAIAKLFEIIGG